MSTIARARQSKEHSGVNQAPCTEESQTEDPSHGIKRSRRFRDIPTPIPKVFLRTPPNIVPFSFMIIGSFVLLIIVPFLSLEDSNQKAKVYSRA